MTRIVEALRWIAAVVLMGAGLVLLFFPTPWSCA